MSIHLFSPKNPHTFLLQLCMYWVQESRCTIVLPVHLYQFANLQIRYSQYNCTEVSQTNGNGMTLEAHFHNFHINHSPLLCMMTCFTARHFLVLISALTIAGIVNAVDPSSYFGGTNIATYLDWANKSSYDRHAWIESSSDSSLGVAIHWTTDDTHIRLAVAANATGWVGFGLSESGSMKGADIIMYTAETDELVDSYVLDDLVTPLPDDCQSWTLVNSITQDGFIIFEATRALNTGDSQDRIIIDDSSSLIPATRVIAAWGDTSTPSYHGVDNRAKSSVRFMGATSSEEELATFRTMISTESEGNFSIQAVDYAIPAVETTYAYFCFSKADLLMLGAPLDNDLHSIGMEPIIDSRGAKYVHHFIVYASTQEWDSSADCAFYPGMEVAYAWAPGATSLDLPSNVGGPLGSSGFKSFKLETHYNNPGLDAGQLDSSGVRFYYTSKKRQYDLGIFETGDPLVNLINTAVSTTGGLSSHTFECPTSCSSTFLNESVTVLGEWLHMHKSGVSMVNSQIRGGEVIRLGDVQFWDFAQQAPVVQEPFKILPGDSFRTTCSYNASNGEVFGRGSSAEMCIAFLYYYPRQTMTSLIGEIPFVCGYGFDAFFPECATDWTTANIADLSQLGRTFGVSPSTCPPQSPATISGPSTDGSTASAPTSAVPLTPAPHGDTVSPPTSSSAGLDGDWRLVHFILATVVVIFSG